MNNPFDYIPDTECDEAFRKLMAEIDKLKKSNDDSDIAFCRELEAGKMLGVLIAADNTGQHHTLYAFSGQIGDMGFHHDGFVGPVFDYLQPEGHFKTNELHISSLTAEIKNIHDGIFTSLKQEYDNQEATLNAEISEYREKCRQSKLDRDARRKSGGLSDSDIADMIRQSQFEKAELHRMKKKADIALEPYHTRLKEVQVQLDTLKEKRRVQSEELQSWLFSNFRLLNALGESKSLKDIFDGTSMRIPPSGAGECCAPKLLQAAFLKGWQPLSIAEYWYGKPKGGELRIHGQHYPACRGKCLPILCWMLHGLEITPPLENRCRTASVEHEPEIIYENQWFCVVNKPSGMLSVPGKGPDTSLEQWLREKFGADRNIKLAHRLDQDTSGLIIATFGDESFKTMQSLFAMRKISKTYMADLRGDFKTLGIPEKGRIALPISPDYIDRPRQKVDFEKGKEAVTEFEFTGVSENISHILFHPHTGRTHQLRVHAASEKGLGMPIVGDRLYGKRDSSTKERLHLHAHRIEFTFPLDSRHYSFTSSESISRMI